MGFLSTGLDWATNALSFVANKTGKGDTIANVAEALGDVLASDDKVSVSMVGALTDVGVTEFLKLKGMDPVKAGLMGDAAQMLAEGVARWAFGPKEAEETSYGDAREAEKKKAAEQGQEQSADNDGLGIGTVLALGVAAVGAYAAVSDKFNPLDDAMAALQGAGVKGGTDATSIDAAGNESPLAKLAARNKGGTGPAVGA